MAVARRVRDAQAARNGKKGKREDGRRDIGARWVEWVVQRLVNNGHDFLAIPDYTLNQVVILLDAIEKQEAATRTSFLTDLAAAIGGVLGGADQFAEHLEDISDTQFEDG